MKPFKTKNMETETFKKAIEINQKIERLSDIQNNLSGKKYGITFLAESYGEVFRCAVPEEMDALIFKFIRGLVRENLYQLEEDFKKL